MKVKLEKNELTTDENGKEESGMQVEYGRGPKVSATTPFAKQE